MKKLFIIPLLALSFQIHAYSTIGFGIINPKPQYYYGDSITIYFDIQGTVLVTDLVQIKMVAAWSTVTIVGGYPQVLTSTSWVVKDTTLPLSQLKKSVGSNTYYYGLKVPFLPKPTTRISIGYNSGMSPSIDFTPLPPITTFLNEDNSDFWTNSVQKSFYDIQGRQLPEEPESGLYIQEAVINGVVSRKKLYRQ
jgi:hypothetical protein